MQAGAAIASRYCAEPRRIGQHLACHYANAHTLVMDFLPGDERVSGGAVHLARHPHASMEVTRAWLDFWMTMQCTCARILSPPVFHIAQPCMVVLSTEDIMQQQQQQSQEQLPVPPRCHINLAGVELALHWVSPSRDAAAASSCGARVASPAKQLVPFLMVSSPHPSRLHRMEDPHAAFAIELADTLAGELLHKYHSQHYTNLLHNLHQLQPVARTMWPPRPQYCGHPYVCNSCV